MAKPQACPCQSGLSYLACCAPLHEGAHASNAEALMRSRYSAYSLGLESYLLETWHPNTRPTSLNLQDDPALKWLGLSIKQSKQLSDNSAIVEFVARYKIGGAKAERMHEISKFELLERWYYLEAISSMP